MQEISVSSSRFCYAPKTVLKNKVYQEKNINAEKSQTELAPVPSLTGHLSSPLGSQPYPQADQREIFIVCI